MCVSGCGCLCEGEREDGECFIGEVRTKGGGGWDVSCVSGRVASYVVLD